MAPSVRAAQELWLPMEEEVVEVILLVGMGLLEPVLTQQAIQQEEVGFMAKEVMHIQEARSEVQPLSAQQALLEGARAQE